MMSWFLAWIGAIVVQRAVELVIAKRNEKRAFARGAQEFGRGHYLLIVLMHIGWFIGLLIEGWLTEFTPLAVPWAAMCFALWVLLQGMRFWILWSMGPHWNTRVLVVPGDTLVSRGPYRFLKHPNYVVVVLELALVPVAFGLWWTAAIVTVLNAILMAIRIPIEAKALTLLQRD